MHPVFEKYDIDFLARVTGYRVEYLRAIRRGAKEASRQFRRLCSLALGEPEDALFHMEPVNA